MGKIAGEPIVGNLTVITAETAIHLKQHVVKEEVSSGY